MNSIIYPSDYAGYRFNPPLRIAIMASGKGSNFEAIAESIYKNELNACIKALIVNNPNCPAVEKAYSHNVPIITIDHRNYNTREEFDEEIIKHLKNLDIELIVMAGWMRVVTKRLIDAFNKRLINIHPSLLPSFKGLKAVQQALDNSVKISGCTVHYVSNEVDSGEIIGQAAVTVNENDNHDSLTAKIQTQEHILLPYSISLAGRNLRSK
ncbi:phosphoribosylglycinamide formyltransferase [Prochlorococcus sp. MIT 1341]|uniref:phosphoribosylglycinamide formyltransferase n=1 Tax=Prochlorococcus sp. MIT 1341 TaxID=3096221 RepID=UPI002A751407|nr:phosphoribosylglycinamide formyltransferase [Prochlorococcus sp. MIT 1341]